MLITTEPTLDPHGLRTLNSISSLGVTVTIPDRSKGGKIYWLMSQSSMVGELVAGCGGCFLHHSLNQEQTAGLEPGAGYGLLTS